MAKKGAKPKDLGPNCVVEEGTGKVYCLACHNSSGANFPSMINRSSWANHIKSPAHSLAVQQVAEAQKQQAATHQQYNDLYNMPRTFLDTPSLPTDLGLGRRAQFRPILLDEDTNGVSAADFRDIMMEETNYLRAVDEQEDFLAKNTEALRREVENLRLRHLEAEFEGADDETIPQLAQEIRDNEMLRATGEDEDEINRHFGGVPIDHDYAPYGNKTMILWIMDACGARDVPSFNKFRAMQKHIRKTTGVRSEAHKSGLGNLFYVNDIRDLIAKDFANPEVAPHIQKYPEDVDGGPVSEIWQVKEGKWHDIPLDELTPSILVGHARYYIHEVAELADGRWIIPALWIVSKGKTYVDCRVLERNNFEVLVVESKITRIPLDDLRLNQEALERRLAHSIIFHERYKKYAQKIPNQYRSIDNGEDLFTVWVPVWADDVSGARSKQYQKHLNVYTANANLPGQLLQQEYFVRFVSTSPHAGALEQLKVVVDQVKRLPFFYEAGRPRNVEDIRRCVLSQISLATYGVASRVDALQTSTGTKDKIAQHWIDILIEKSREMQASTPGRSVDEISNELLVWLAEETDEPYNPLLDLPFFDPSQDTLVEILHTILLGHAKYTWYELHHNWTAVQQDLFTIRLQGTNLDGLRYRNGLIGKHFKSLMQTMIFHIHDLVTPDQFALVRALGELGPILWMPVIDNMEEYLADLQILIDNILDAFAAIDPAKILIKLKLHVLAHIPDDIRRRGPSVRFSTEVFECFNAIFRLCSVLTYPEWGYWFDESESAWVRGGKDVQRILRNTPIIQRHLGWAPPPFWTPGQIKAVAQKKQGKLAALTADQAMLSGATNPASIALDPATSWTDGTNVASVSGDCCTVGSWAVFRVHDFPMIARVSKILYPKAASRRKGFSSWPSMIPVKPFTHITTCPSSFRYGRTTHNSPFGYRRRRHDELSAILTVTQKAKRAATQEKAAATREKNKAAKAQGQMFRRWAPPAQAVRKYKTRRGLKSGPALNSNIHT
ncbi:hypothetical protein B0H13DRAFT_1918579, partial [Mycena leptocephala]